MMFGGAYRRALRKGALCTALSECPRSRLAFHSLPPSPLRRTQRIQQTVRFWYPARNKSSTTVAAKKLFKEYPFSVSLATVLILCGMGSLVYINYIYQSYIIGGFKAFPEPVAVKLRRALYYTNIDLQPKNALKYYRQALEIAVEMGMNEFSDEILGVKIQIAKLFEDIHLYQKAIDVLEIVRSDCLRWLEELGGKPGNEGMRTKVLTKTIGISIKLGEYYATEYIGDQEAAEERLVWAVTALLKEQKRREDEGVKEGEGEWMSNEEIGGALELNNLAISLAQQYPSPGMTRNQAPSSPASHLSDAQQWGLKALELASSISPPQRTRECDEGCAVATINLGDFAMMNGDPAEARRRFKEGRAISKGIDFLDGVARADQSLKELRKRG